MEKQEKEKALTEEISEEPGDETAALCSEEIPAENEEQEDSKIDSAAESGGRLMFAGLVATAILAGIAVLVAGTIQLTSKWLISCPTDLPVNDPAPILWNKMISDKASPALLGIPEGRAIEVRFKGFLPEEKPEGRGEH
jgi:hypothetical protein